MSNSSESGPKQSTREALGRLAESAPEETTRSSVPEAEPVVPPRSERLRTYARRTVLTITLLLCIAFFTVSGIYLRNPTIRSIVLAVLGHPIKFISSGHLDPTGYYNLADHFPPDKRKSLTVLMLGSDHDSAKGIRIPGHNAVPVDVPSGPGRSDSVMIARFEFDGDSVRSVNVLSIPRDTRVRIPGYGIHKINAAHAYGGPELTCATVRDVFGIDPDYYIDLNFEGFQQVVDAVGGVDINVDRRLEYYDDWAKLYIDLKPGPQHLNGYKAMGYVRFRHTRTKSGKAADAATRATETDLVRAQRQHEFIEAMRARVTSPGAFLSLPNAVAAITNNLHSNLSQEQMLTLANLARKAPKDAIDLETLPVIEGKAFVYIDRRKSMDLVRKMFFKDKQVVLDIKTPDSEIAPIHRRKRHVKDSGPAPDLRHRKSVDAGADNGANPDSAGRPTSDATGGASGAPQSKDSDDLTDKSERQPVPEPPKTESTTTPDGVKPPAKSKDGTGTSFGSTSTAVRS